MTTAKRQHLLAKITMSAGIGAVAAIGVAPAVATAAPAVTAVAASGHVNPDYLYHG